MLQMGGLLLEMLAISLAEIPKRVFAHSEVEILLVFPVRVNPSHASPQEAHISQNPCSLGAAQTLRGTAGNEPVAGKAKESRVMTKATLTVLCGSCADSNGKFRTYPRLRRYVLHS